jgi:hypothetical protein
MVFGELNLLYLFLINKVITGYDYIYSLNTIESICVRNIACVKWTPKLIEARKRTHLLSAEISPICLNDKLWYC